MKTLKTIEQVRSAMNGIPVYVRWSRGPSADARMGGCSKDYTSGTVHAGLSACRIDAEWSDERIARQLVEYRFLRIKDARIFGWILTGQEIGQDSDGASSVSNAAPVGKLDEPLVDGMGRYYRAYIDAERRQRDTWQEIQMPRLADYI